MSNENSYKSSTVASSTSAALLSRIQELRNWQAQQRLQLEQSRSPSVRMTSFSKALPGYNDLRHTKDFPQELEYVSNSGTESNNCTSHWSEKPLQSCLTLEGNCSETDLIKEREVLGSFNPSLKQESNVADTIIPAEAKISELFLEERLEDIGVIKPQPAQKKKFLRKGEGLRRFMGVKATRKCLSPHGQGAQSDDSSTQGQVTQKENLSRHNQGSQLNVKRSFLKKGEGLRRWKGLGSGSTNNDANKNVREFIPMASKKELCKQPIPKLRLQALSGQIKSVAELKDGLDTTHKGVKIDLQAKNYTNVREEKMHRIKCLERELKGCESGLEVPSRIVIEKALRKEEKELNAFEKLEELAADSSFSSNSSVVIQLLHQGLHSQTSTPLKTSVSELTPLSSKSSLSDTSTSAAGVQKVASSNLLARFIETPPDNLVELQDCIYESSELNDRDGHLNVSEMLVKLSKLMQHREVASKIYNYLEQPSLQTVDMFEPNWQGHVTPLHTKPTPRVHFRPQGADVLEYEGDDTLTDASSLTEDDTELVTTSELEALASLDWNFHERMKSCGLGSQLSELQRIDEEEVNESYMKEGENLTEESESSRKDLMPCMLEYSPPPKSVPKHASHPICGNRRNPNEPKVKNLKEVAGEKAKGDTFLQKKVSDPQPTPAELDVQTMKALLMTKVVELELEIETFKKESAEMSVLQDKIQKEKKAFEGEKLVFMQEMETEKEKLKKYIEHEKQQLWREKQALISRSQSQIKVGEDHLSIAYLKEKYEDLQNEIKKKEANNLASEKKLKEKLNFYEFENKSLKKKIVKIEALEKENKNLKVQIKKLEATRTKKNIHLKSAQKYKVAHENKLIDKNKKTFKSVNENVNKQDFPKRDGNDVSIQDVYPVCSIDPKSVIGGQNLTRCVRFEDHIDYASTHSVPLALVPNVPVGDNCTTTLPENVEDSYNQGVGDQVEDTIRAVVPATSPAAGVDASPDAPPLDCTENYNADGTLEIIYANGNKKEVHKNGTCIIHYYNGDVKEIHQDKVVYMYGSDQTWHTTFKDGMEIVEFASGQREVKHPDGSSEIIFTDKTRKMVSPDGSEELTTSDGTVICTKPDGSKVFQFTNGQREVHEQGEKRREYPDGTIKILHSDGLMETHYRNGRRRVRDKEGNLLMDSIT